MNVRGNDVELDARNLRNSQPKFPVLCERVSASYPGSMMRSCSWYSLLVLQRAPCHHHHHHSATVVVANIIWKIQQGQTARMNSRIPTECASVTLQHEINGVLSTQVFVLFVCHVGVYTFLRHSFIYNNIVKFEICREERFYLFKCLLACLKRRNVFSFHFQLVKSISVSARNWPSLKWK